MLVNQKSFNLKSKITDDWGGSHRVVLDLEALSTVKDWKIGISLSKNYKIDQIYDGEITTENGKTYISGADWNKNIKKGDRSEIVLIVDEGNSSNSAPKLPQLFFADSVDKSSNKDLDRPNSLIDFNSKVTEDWNGGYKLEVDLTAKADVKDWEVDFSLPYTIRDAYGVDLIDRGNGKYTIGGQNGWANLQKGQSIKSIFIVRDNGQLAIAPKPTSFSSDPAPKGATTEKTEVSQSKTSTPAVDPMRNNLVAKPDGQAEIISVDNEFGGNLERAIAAANDGDVVRLGSKTYYTKGFTVNKDITIDGQPGSTIDGGGTKKAIIKLTPGATGATIQDVEITNGNTGIDSYGAFDLTLQNLDVNNIGITQTIRGGQNNTAINLNRANGARILNSEFSNIGRKGIGIGDTDGAMVSGITVEKVNLAAQHAQSHDAAGIKFFNTNDITVKNSYFAKINAFGIWNDTTNATAIVGNVIKNAGDSFKAPSFNKYVDIAGIYNEKSSNSIVKNNKATAVDDFKAFQATEFSTETMTLEGNNFSSMAVNTQDYWVNESAEKLIAVTEDPDEANFDLFANDYYAQANIG